VETNYGKLLAVADLQGKLLQKEVSAIVDQQKAEIQKMKNKHMSTLDTNTEVSVQKMTELKQIISDLKSVIDADNITLS
jgi:(p)ppGpp synthase/HD superfamily hydrolase